MRTRPAPDPVAEQVHGDVDREIGQRAADREVVGQQVVHAEAADQRVALRAAVGDVAALHAGAVAVAQRADPALGQRAGVDHGHEDAVDVGQGQEAAAVLGEARSTSTPTIARTGARHDQHVSSTASSVAGSRPRGPPPRRRPRRPSGSARGADGLQRFVTTSCSHPVIMGA